MIRYHFDLYPRDDPKDGARLVRFTKLQSMEYRAEANGTGAGRFSIRGDDDEAQFIDPRGLQYVRVVEEGATEDERVVGGFWLENGDFGALTERGTRLLNFGGPGTIAYLGREVLWSRAYLYAADNIIDGTTWHFYNQPSIAGGDYLGAVLWRVMAEAQSFASPVVEVDDKPETAIPESSTSFGQFNDSAANLWTVPSGEFKAQVGDNILTIVRRLMEAGLYVEANPDTFVINAWERGATSSRGQDKTGPAWATDVIRFQAPTDGTVATGNVKSDAKRGVSPFLVASTVLAGDNGTYVAETDATVGVAWHRWQQSDAQDTDTLTYIADSQLASRGDAADTLRLRMKIGTDPTLGEYIPLSDYEPSGTEPNGSVMLNDLVTVHTGTGQWDYNEDTFPVSALTISLRPGGDWDAWVDLGSSYTSMAERAFQARGVATHTHPPNPELCRPNTVVAPTLEASGYLTSGTGAGSIGEVPALTDGLLLVVAGWFWSTNPPAKTPFTATWTVDGTPYELTRLDSACVANLAAGADPALEVFYLLNPPAVGVGDNSLDVQDSSGGGAWKGFFLLENVNQSDPFGTVDTATGTGTATSGISISEGQTLVNAAWGYLLSSGIGAPTPDVGQTEDWAQATTPGQAQFGGGHGSATPSWTFDESSDWAALGLGINGIGSGGDSGPMPVGANSEASHGTSIRATRCDHVHPHSDLSDHPDEIHHHASSIEFTPTGTIAATDVQAAIAEVAAEATGVTDHGGLTGLADDDHPQYQTEAEVDAQIAAALAVPPTGYYRPVMDGYGNVITDSGTGAALMAYAED